MIRFGLCCMFREQPIKFRTATAKSLNLYSREQAQNKLAELCLANAEALYASLRFCYESGIGCFRVNSQIMPLRTHPGLGYEPSDLPSAAEVERKFRLCGEFAITHGMRLSFHPDQFVVLNSQNPEVVKASIDELEYQAEVAEWVGADVINIHAGGAYGDKQLALLSFARSLDRLSDRVRTRLTVENDDRTFTPEDLLPICREASIPLVYDVHHHRCNPDALTVVEATNLALETWDREPLFHVSSPAEGWNGPRPARHHDYIDVNDFPEFWRSLEITVEVEAKAKEVAVLALIGNFRSHDSIR